MWDGGISRGLDAREVPYANTAKDARFVDRPVATGLWSRYGKVIHAPAWWLDALPTGVNLDVELWCGRGTFQEMRSVVGRLTPDDAGWRRVKAVALDAPGWHAVLADGELTGTNWKTILHRGMMDWVVANSHNHPKEGDAQVAFKPFMGFGQPDECFRRLRELWEGQHSDAWQPHEQVKLPGILADARSVVDDMLLLVTEGGGEGLVLRSGTSAWVPKRVPWVLKVKKLSDAEGTVVGYTWGRETSLGSKLLGMMGALVLDFRGKRLELSGFTNEERQMVGGPDAVPGEGFHREGQDVKTWHNPTFPIGSKVTFTYRELTVDGIPKEARYLRKRDDGV